MTSLESLREKIINLKAYIAIQREVEDNLQSQIDVLKDRRNDVHEDIYECLIEVHDLELNLHR